MGHHREHEISHADREAAVQEHCENCMAAKHGLTDDGEISEAVEKCADSTCKISWRQQRRNQTRVKDHEIERT